MVDLLKETYTGNRGYATWQAINTGKWINKNSDFIDTVSWQGALFRFVTGLSPAEQNDLWSKRLTMKERKESQTWFERRFQEEMNRGFMSQHANNPQQAEKFFTRAMGWIISADVDMDELSKWLARAGKGNESLINRTNWEYYIRTAPASKKQELLKAFEQTKRQ